MVEITTILPYFSYILAFILGYTGRPSWMALLLYLGTVALGFIINPLAFATLVIGLAFNPVLAIIATFIGVMIAMAAWWIGKRVGRR